MQYTSSGIDYDGENSCDLPETDIIDIGDADENKAIVKRTPHREFLAPWTVSRTCETRFAVNQRLSPTSSYTPLTADQAFYVLAEFALLHNLRSQFPIALMTAITLPTHEHYGSTVQLALPRKFGGKQPTLMEAIPSIWSSLNQELPYYMTLSCSPKVLMSTLCGSFWGPEVPYNLVAPWLHPLFNEILQQNEKSPTVSQDYETLALIGAIRRPNIGALWIGAVAGGLAPKIVKKKCKQSIHHSTQFPFPGLAVSRPSWIFQAQVRTRMEDLNKSQGQMYGDYYTFLKQKMMSYFSDKGLGHPGNPGGHPHRRIVHFESLPT
ncbi:hypothetical protein PENFLA_c001G02116 [Penicillium flavigenum]|uniref:Uncharacterized protein n=1 Tax=Penicillium flavigenum TaxID=254877 RepID=A0A1V6U273_9EURO|nr:hypothetical protein PENFLA_c001G02116 [Penicillium flavigenum]